MDIREMQCILTVVKEGNLARAAEKLFLTPPAVSKIVVKIENTLGVDLFDRTKTPWELTHAGELFVKKSKYMLKLEDIFLKDISDISKNKKGHLTIGTMYFEEKYLIAGMLALFKKKQPNFQIRLKTNSSGEVERNIINENVNFGIITLPNKNVQLECIPIKTYKLVIILPIEHELAKDYNYPINQETFPEIDLHLLRDYPFILLKPFYSSTKIVAEACEKVGFRPNVDYNVATMEAAYTLVATGCGVAFILDEIRNYHPMSDKVAHFNVKGQEVIQTVAFAYKKGKVLNDVEQTFLDILLEKE